MNTEEAYKLITRALSNEASPDEKNRLEQWRKEDPSNEQLFRQTEYIWNQSKQEADDTDTNAAWKKLNQRIELTERGQNRSFTYFLRIAAVLLLVCGIGFFASYLFFSRSMNQVQTADNEIKQVTLPDGSLVWLNANSTLSYPSSFDKKERSVKLEGEAFFEVQKDPSKPFVISAQQTLTKVLGTSFNLRAYEQEAIYLNVSTGRVSFQSIVSKQEVIVSAGQKALIEHDGHAHMDESVGTNDLGWKERKLIFNDARLDEVFASLSKYFHVTIKPENAQILQCHFTAEFTEPKLSQVLDVLCKTLQLSYEKKGKQVNVKGKGC